MMQCKWIGTGCLGVVLSMAGSMAWAASQDQQEKPPYTLAEYNTFRAADKEQNPQAKIKLLDEFAVQYPGSALMPDAYRVYYLTYFSMKNYPQTVEYADKLLALGDKIDLGTRLEVFVARAQANYAGCGDIAFQTPEAYAKARDAAIQGLQTLSQWPKPQDMTDEQFAAQRQSIGMLFSSEAGIAESGLKGEKADSCKDAPALDPGRFDRMINGIKTQERQSPRVR